LFHLNNPETLKIGLYADNPGDYLWFSGTIDEAMIFNRALSAQQIKALNNSQANLIVSDETTLGETWFADVTPNDGFDDGLTLRSNNVTIINSVPEITSLVLNATDHPDNTSAANLTLHITAQDNDGHPVKNITNWFVDGKSITVLNMPFEANLTAELGTKVRDYSSYGNNGTVNDAMWNANSGYDGKGAFEFDGDGDYIETNNNIGISGSSPRTMLAWAKSDEAVIDGSDNFLIAFGQGSNARHFGMYIEENNDEWCMHFYGADPCSGTNVDTLWHLHVLTYDGAISNYYLDGSFLFYNDTVLDTVDSAVRIGRQMWTSGRTWNGTIDDVIIFNRSLSAVQIKALYENKTEIIVSDETSAGETWYSIVVPNDGYEDGLAVQSNNVTIIDNTPPSIEIVTPLDDDLLGWTVLLRANVSDVELDTVWFEIINESDDVIYTAEMNDIGENIFNSSLITNDTWPYDTSVLNSTNLTFVVYANDTTNNLASENTTWTLDNTDPSIQFINPPFTGMYLNSNFSFDIFMSNHLLNYSYYNITTQAGSLVQENSSNLSSNIATWDDFVDVSVLGDGLHYVNVYARDYVGNNRTRQAWFFVDRVVPTFSNAVNTSVDFRKHSNFTANITINDNELNSALFWSNASGSWQSYATDAIFGTESNVSTSVNITVGRGNSVCWYYWANDTSGNSNTSETYCFTVENTVSEHTYPFIGAHEPSREYIDSGIVAYYKFENGAVDETSENNGTVYNAVNTYEGRVGKAYKFEGNTNSYITVPHSDSLNITDELTVSAWINPDDIPSSDRWIIVEKLDGGFYLTYNSASQIAVYWYGTSSQGYHNSVSTIDVNEWTHVLATWNSTHVLIYINGEEDRVVETQTPGSATQGNLVIGKESSNRFFNGSIDEVIIWNRSLTASEVGDLYNYSSGKYKVKTTMDLGCALNDSFDIDLDSIKPIFNWYKDNRSITLLNMPFENNGSDSGTTDYSGYGNDGTEGGTPTWNSVGGYDGKGAYVFDGDDYINLGDIDSFDSQEEMTVSLWVKPLSSFAGASRYIAVKEDVWYLFQSSSDELGFAIHGTSGIKYNIPSFNDWYHFVGIYDGVFESVYVNGEFISEGISVSMPSSNYPLSIGARFENGVSWDDFFNGTIDEVLIFNISLSAEQVNVLYQNGSQTIVADDTTKGDTWHCSVTANDGYSNDGTYNSSYVYIENAKPVMRTVIINSTSLSNKSSEDLYCHVNSSEYDSENVSYSGYWYRNGEENLSFNTAPTDYVASTIVNVAVLGSDNTTIGDNWSCYVRAYDGEEYGDYLMSVNLTVLTPNAAPNITSLILNSTDHPLNYSNANLTLHINATDADNDSIKNITTWYVDGKSIMLLNMPFEANGGSESTTTYDYSSYNYDGTMYGATWNATAGYDGKGAYSFGGDSDYIDAGDLGGFPEKGTLMFWMYPDQVLNFRNPLTLDFSAGNSGIRFETQTTGKYTAVVNYNGHGLYDFTSNGINVDTWYHTALAWDSIDDRVYGYLDAEEKFNMPHDHWPSDISDVQIGRGLLTDNERSWNGTIDEVMIFNRTLSKEQIKAWYENKIEELTFAETRSGEEWYAIVVPNDGYEDGSAFQSNNVTIANIAVENVVLNTTTGNNRSTDNLTVYSDLVNSSEKVIINWYKDDSSIIVLNMPFDAKDNAWRDYTEFGNNATLNGALWNRTGGYDGMGAYYLNGTGAYIEISDDNSLDLSTEFTIVYRIKRYSDSGQYERVLSKSNKDASGSSDWAYYSQISSGDVIQVGGGDASDNNLTVISPIT
jgi:hypothetical protein